MSNQEHSNEYLGGMRANDRTEADPNSPETLHTNGSPSQDDTQDSENFNPSLHLSLMSGYWREPPACPQLVTTVAECDPVTDHHEAPNTPESWLKFRFKKQSEEPTARKRAIVTVVT